MTCRVCCASCTLVCLPTWVGSKALNALIRTPIYAPKKTETLFEETTNPYDTEGTKSMTVASCSCAGVFVVGGALY